MRSTRVLLMTVLLQLSTISARGDEAVPADFRLSWEKNMLTVTGKNLPGGKVPIWYLEAYCRPGSTDREWGKTVIGHTTQLISATPDGREIRLQCALNDGVTVKHTIRAVEDGVAFELTAHNPTARESQAHWAQPCVRVDAFTGADQKSYLARSFVFLNGRLERMPTPGWSTTARYTPGQTWAAPGVDRNDVNPRPLNDLVPTSGLIGCFSKDDSAILATAWEPYQELFQGVIVCLHSDFRIGGLKPDETKTIRGRLYLIPNDLDLLQRVYRRDFPQQQSTSSETP